MKTDGPKIEEILSRNVQEVISKPHLEKRLKKGEKLRVKFGIDPTSADLHLGHSLCLRKLKNFQDLGHQIIFLIGDFTAQIGDPSDRANTRKPLTSAEIEKNMKDYISQADRILDIKKVEIRHNSEWYNKKNLGFLINLTSRFTHARLVERDDFQKRIKANIDISMSELLYPLLQGYDSVELRADLEIGGSDQKFNLLMGRKVQKKYNLPEQDIITLPLLIGTDGEVKMSKSYGNYIGLKESAAEMFGKIMSIPDKLIWDYFKLLTDLSLSEIERIKKETKNPRDAKNRLALEITAFYYGVNASRAAESEFQRVFKEKKAPAKIEEVKIKERALAVMDLLVGTGQAASKSEAKRLILQGGVKINDKLQPNWQEIVQIKKGMIIQTGKRKFIKIN